MPLLNKLAGFACVGIHGAFWGVLLVEMKKGYDWERVAEKAKARIPPTPLTERTS